MGLDKNTYIDSARALMFRLGALWRSISALNIVVQWCFGGNSRSSSNRLTNRTNLTETVPYGKGKASNILKIGCAVAGPVVTVAIGPIPAGRYATRRLNNYPYIWMDS